MKFGAIVVLFVVLAAAAASASEWTETVSLKGDLRYRHEQIDQQGESIRNRQRMRARLTLTAEPEDNLELGFRLVSGSDDPVSSNQTLDGAFATKDIMLDRAYFTWTHAETGATVTGGKMRNPFYVPAKSELIWDSDLSPEGLELAHRFGEGDTKFFVRGAGLWLDERKSSANAALFGGQAGLEHKTGGVQFTVGGSYFNYTKLDGPLYDDDFFGNTSSDDAFMKDFNLIEVFVELGFKAGKTPITAFADFVSNQEADTAEQAYLFGVKLGKAKKPGSLEAMYNYREVQKDAVVGVLTDSDFRGGGTDGKGHEFGFGYQLSDQSKFAFSYFINSLGLENGTDFNRLMADLQFKF